MIEISPAILTQDKDLVANLLETYSKFDINQIDIDFVEESFAGNDTVPLEEVLSILASKPVEKRIGFHLMFQNPEKAVKLIEEAKISDYMIYVHLESKHDFLLAENMDLGNFGLAFNLDTELPDLEVLEKFSEVQFMSIETGKQGNPFDEAVADKVAELRNMGYTGRVSLDGGINLRTASFIKDWPIDRVSVGSYLQNSKNAELNLMKLQLALNLRTE